ncbi:beta-phosphoglucomutase [Sphingomonas sp.]|uniref:beta-phosphoglucomutase n=1 Tax=Sphingomonas sp. TaxID=28214 RepID=UPI003D6D6E9B
MSAFPRPLDAIIFDLDGVLTDTAEAHFRAWKRLADSIGVPFDHAANEQLKGIDRMGSLDRIIGDRPGFDATERTRLATVKNGWYLEEIAGFTPTDLFPGASAVLKEARGAGLKIALASASRNAPLLLERLGIAALFDAVADPAAVAVGKPAPDIFLAAARAVDVAPALCLGVEDAEAGITAIRAAGMASLGIGSPAILAEADRVIAAIGEFRLGEYRSA